MEMLNFQMLKLNEEFLVLYNKIQDKAMDVKKTMNKIDDIVKKTMEAKELLERVKNIINNEKENEIEILVKRAVCCKLMIPEDETEDLRNLAVLSVKYQDQSNKSLSDDVIRSKIEKYDCHQTNLISQKKTLLIMFVEKELGLSFTDEDAVGISTVSELCKMIRKYKGEKQT